jgi:EAL domain-containing protein (putative c-di-GMP-specific phosphodiesterase class I)
LVEALTTEQLLLFYQPKVRLKTQQICGAEALIRWQHPIHGLISPRKLISLAENFELMHEPRFGS